MCRTPSSSAVGIPWNVPQTMEEFRSYVEQCNKTKALLPGWHDHRVKVEAELRELARQLEDWEVELITAAINSMVASGAEAADGAIPPRSSVPLRLPKSGQRRFQRRRGRRFLCNDGTKGPTSLVFAVKCGGVREKKSVGRMLESASSKALQDHIGSTVALLEQDKILTEDLAKAIDELIDKEFLFLEKINFGGHSENGFFLPPETSVSALIAVVWRLSRQNFSMQKFLCDMLGILMDLNWSLHLAEAVRNITNLALEGSQYRGEVSLQLRTFADKAGQCQSVCRLIMEYLEIR
ncbi:unnamed protein product [Cylicocyclus nassatus]|uniref:Uncharacterized protein n=1 Tax=Cylicocyclus nassatus TaxID=53992 RepID=A0AA36MA61_CYLNA|nr:unnamed protein product [Cylicocyclus nassatus]